MNMSLRQALTATRADVAFMLRVEVVVTVAFDSVIFEDVRPSATTTLEQTTLVKFTLGNHARTNHAPTDRPRPGPTPSTRLHGPPHCRHARQKTTGTRQEGSTSAVPPL